MYDVGYRLGRAWAVNEASQHQLQRVDSLECGKAWIIDRDDPSRDLRQLIDPDKTGFLDVDEPPVPNFVAGFIDGAQSVK